MAKKQRRKKNWRGEPFYGTGLRVLVVNDQVRILHDVFGDAFSDARLVYCETAKEALAKIRATKRSGKLFNAVLIDKNLGYGGKGRGAQDVVNAVERLSPKSHICIHSGETGPGKFTTFPFVSFGSADVIGDFRKFIVVVEKQPFRKVPSKIDLAVLKRPIPVITKSGAIRVFCLVEGSSPPKQMQKIIKEGGRAMSITEAIEMSGRISSARDRSALLAERTRATKFQKAVKKAQKKTTRRTPKKPPRRHRP